MRHTRVLMTALLLVGLVVPASAQTLLNGRAAESLYNRLKYITPTSHFYNDKAVLTIDQNGSYARYTDDQLTKWFAAHLRLYRDEHMPKGVLTEEQAAGMVHLGELLQVGHFSLTNSADPQMRAVASNTCKQLAAILASTQSPAVDTFTKLSTSLTDKGATDAQIGQYDAAIRKVTDYVFRNYGRDALWYFGLGTSAAGLHALYSGGDQFHTQEYRALLHTMLTNEPDLAPSAGVIADINHLFDIGWPEDYYQDIAVAAQKLLDHYWTGKGA